MRWLFRQINSVMQPFGFELRRTVCRAGAGTPKSHEAGLIEVFEGDPFEAIFASLRRSQREVVISFPTSKLVSPTCFPYSAEAFHPWVMTLMQSQADEVSYEQSVLKAWYEMFCPLTLSQFLLGREVPGASISAQPPAQTLMPFSFFDTCEKAIEYAVQMTACENQGDTSVSLAAGSSMMGPKTVEKGVHEFNRLLRVRNAIRSEGYRRTPQADGDICGLLLQWNSGYRIVVRSGQHRAAALASLGYKEIPVRLITRHVIDSRDVDRWPLVKAGVWTRELAVEYFQRLFTFDSVAWAIKNGLIPAASTVGCKFPF